ncbi:MAG TPA: LytR C-terminal domain-containing protein [Actinomycetota bacterium]
MRPGPTARAAAVLVVFLALFIAVDRWSAQRPGRDAVAGGTTTRATTSSTTPPTTAAPTTTARPTTTTTPETTSSSTTTTTRRRPPTSSTLRPAKGVTVQVLNAVFVPGLARRVAELISDAGYDVVATNTALGSYKVSRIYYTDGHRADAVAFQRRFPAFEQAFPASRARAHLDPAVDLHVIIGDNYREIRGAR